jgi:hypothetical protein
MAAGYGIAQLRAWLATKGRRKLELLVRAVISLLVLAVLVALPILADAKIHGSALARSHWAQGLALVEIFGFTLFIWTLGAKRYYATSEISVPTGDAKPVKQGAQVPPKVAALAEVAGKINVERIAIADFGYKDSEGKTQRVREGDDLDASIADLPEAKDKVQVKRTAKVGFTYHDGEPTVYGAGATVPRAVAQENLGKVRERRSFFLRNLVVGQDGRWSTSKLQAVLWTYTVLFAILAIVTAKELLEVKLGLGKNNNRNELSALDLPPEYYLLLGGPFAAAIIAKASTSAKVASGDVTKPPQETPTSNPIDGIKDVVSNDTGNTDLFDFQYFAFNLLALLFFYVTFFSTLSKGLPHIPEPLFGLTSTAALAYTTKKAIERSSPTVSGVSPTTVRPGATIEVWGANLLASEGDTTVQVGGHPAKILERHPDPRGTDRFKVKLPDDISGTAPLVVIPAGGQPTPPTDLTVEGITITSVSPDPIVARDKSRVVISGSGFGAAEGQVLLGDTELTVITWTATVIVTAIKEKEHYPVGPSVPLQVAVGGQVGSVAKKVEALRIDDVSPKTIKGVEGEELRVSGLGLDTPELEGKLAGTKLHVVAASEGHLVAVLKGPVEGGDRKVVLMDPVRNYSAEGSVKVTGTQ